MSSSATLERANAPPAHTWRLIACALFLLTLVSVLLTLSHVGVTWDEPLYMKASRGYMTWLGLLRRGTMEWDLREPLSDAAIVRWWVQDPTLELHPPLGKFLSGLTWAGLRALLGDISAHRVGNAVLFSLMVAMVFWMTASAYGVASGVFAALSLLLMPRMFFHAHLANIDTTIAITWFAAMFVFWRCESRAGWWPVMAMGVAFGLALASKLNAIVMPAVWLVWTAVFRRTWRAVLRLVAAAVIGAAVFVVCWPWLYHDTLNRLLYYFFMASRFKDRPQFYLGQTFPHVPWHYPFVITLVVVPLVITVMYMLGIVRVLRCRSDDSTGLFLLLNTALPLGVAATGLQAAYSGERHFIPAYPYLACLAGAGFGWLLDALSEAWVQGHGKARLRTVRRWLAGLLALLLLPPLVSLVKSHPYELSYYSELVGGLPGATRLGLETTFWCETYQDALPYLNANAGSDASVWAENPFVLRFYQREGMLRDDLEVIGGDVVSPRAADYAVVQMRQTGLSYVPEVVDLMQNHVPVYTRTHQGIPVLHVYGFRQ